jgi:hypothetical protein
MSKNIKPSERIQELRKDIAFDMFGIEEGKMYPSFQLIQAKGAASENLHVAIAAIIQYLDEQADG